MDTQWIKIVTLTVSALTLIGCSAGSVFPADQAENSKTIVYTPSLLHSLDFFNS